MWTREHSKALVEANLLDVIPVRLAPWEEKGKRVVVSRPRTTRTGLSGAIDRLLFLLSARRIRLDDAGSYAWLNLDGNRSVGTVAELLRHEFGDSVEPAEERLGHLVRVFRREGLVAYRGWDDDVLSASAMIGSQPQP